MPDIEHRVGTAADRLLKIDPLPEGSLGWTTDEGEAFHGSADTAIGRPGTSPQAPKQGLDVRRLFTAASQGQSNTWTDVDGVARDGSGFVISPRPHAAPTVAGTDVLATGRILANELADGGTIELSAIGTWKSGSIVPRILANLKIGGAYVRPQYEQYAPSAAAAAVDLASLAGADNASRPFEWSALTIGLNALAGYEALNVGAPNLTQGEITWRLTVKIHALGRWSKWSHQNAGGVGSATLWSGAAVAYVVGNRVRSAAGTLWRCIADHVSAAATEPGVGASYATVWVADPMRDRNCWVEATLEFGALHMNVGARSGEGYGYANPTSPVSVQYNATHPAGVVRGAFYSFLNQKWLCHAGSATESLDAVANPDVITSATWLQMLAEEAPGMGVHWRDFFVPAVTTATISGYIDVDWTVENEIQLEMGGPQQVDLGTAFPAYSALTSYLPENGLCSAAGVNYVAKTFLLTATAPHFGWIGSPPVRTPFTSDTTGVTPTFTFPPTGDPNSDRCWRALPAAMRDEMRVQHVQGYLFGRRNGVAERRV